MGGRLSVFNVLIDNDNNAISVTYSDEPITYNSSFYTLKKYNNLAQIKREFPTVDIYSVIMNKLLKIEENPSLTDIIYVLKDIVGSLGA